MKHKVSIILFKTIGVILLAVFILLLTLFLVIQSYSFQTWLGKKVSVYLSTELNTKIDISSIQIEFFKSAQFKNVFLKDLKDDTLFQGNLTVNVRTFDYKKKKLYFNIIHLQNANSKIIKYKNETEFNYKFIENYFKDSLSTTNNKSSWDIQISKILIEKINFTYKIEGKEQPPMNNINFNDISVRNLTCELVKPTYNNDTFKVRISNLSFEEKSKFKILHLRSNIEISPKNLFCEQLNLRTPNSLLKGDLKFNFKEWDNFNDFVNEVHFNSTFEDSSKISFKDIACFATQLNGLTEVIKLSGNAKGTVNDFSLKKFNFKFGNYTQFNGNLSLSGLPDIENSFLHFDAKTLSTNYLDLIQIPEFPFYKKQTLKIPSELKKLGTISYQGKFDGLIKDFTTYGQFKTALGIVSSQLSIQLADKTKDINYHGKLSTQSFDLGELIGINNFNKLSMDLNIDGKGIELKTINSKMKGTVHSISFQNYHYKNIELNGSFQQKIFNGVLTSLDTNANFDFNGSIDFKNKVPEMYFISAIHRLNLNKLNLINKADSGDFSTQLFININGSNIDNLSGQINFDNTVFKTINKTYKLNKLNVDIDQNKNTKSIVLKSEYVNSKMNGKFNISNLKACFSNLLHHYYPSIFEAAKETKPIQDQFEFELVIKKFKTIQELFLPNLMISDGSKIFGDFNANNQTLNIDFNSKKIVLNGFKFNEVDLQLNEKDSTVFSNVNINSIWLSDSVKIENFKTSINSMDSLSKYTIEWNNNNKPCLSGNLRGRFSFGKNHLKFNNDIMNLCFNDSIWQLKQSSELIFKNKLIEITPLQLYHHQQSILLNGKLSDQENDSLQIKVNHLLLSEFNPLLNLIKLKVEGEMNGSITMSKPNNHFALNGHLNLQKLKVNENIVGELVVQSFYDTKDKFLKLSGFTSLGLQDEFGNQIKNIAFNGFYYLDNRSETINIDLIANPANIKLLNPFLTDILTIKNGYVSGVIKIHGTNDILQLDGKLRLYNSEVKVDYTNVVYNISGDIEIMPDQIRFSDLLMREKGTKAAPQGTINGNVFHKNFKNIQLDYDISYKNMLVLNTTEKENKLYYGKIYSTGKAGLYGYLNNLNLQIFDTITRNSKFILPLDGPTEIEEDDFVHFVRRDTIKIEEKNKLSGFNLDLYVYATPSSTVQIILDKQNGDMLNAQGEGNINLKINTLGKFEMIGDYMITNGDYLFTLEHVINKKFDIEAGSRISWNGNPTNADINVATSYKQRTSVAPLLNDTTGLYKGRFAVDCKLQLSGKLFSPIINFGFDFPNIEATAKARIASVLSDEAEMNRQVFSFLLFRNFVTPQIFNTNFGGVSAGGAAASTSSELLSNKVSGFLNSYFGGLTGLKDLQLGLNYRPGNQTSKESVDLNLSKQFLNNKISVDGNFGVNNSQATNSGGFIGDVNIDYKLTEDGRYRLTGFNRTNNTAQITVAGGPYTQGVGFFYRREFNAFSDLLKRKKTLENQRK